MSSNTLNVAVVGANGFVGSNICNTIEESEKYKLIRVTRGDEIQVVAKNADLVIHAANPAGRFKAETNPLNDFMETADKTFQILSQVKDKPFIMLSSLSCRTQLNTNYGRNRRFCELLVLAQGGKVVRLGPMFGGERKKDTLHDLLVGRQVYISSETRYAYADVSWVAKRIVELLSSPSGLYEIGARNAISLKELHDYFSSKSNFSGTDDTQIPEQCDDGPDARLVLDFAQKELDVIDTWR